MYTYRDLLNPVEYKRYNTLRNYASFPINDIAHTHILNDYQITEYRFSGLLSSRDDKLFAKKLAEFKSFLNKKLLNSNNGNYLFYIEHKPNLACKLRTYKGLLNKKNISTDNCLQMEFPANGNMSIIAFVAKITDDSFDYLINNFFFDDSLCFILSSDENNLSEAFLNDARDCFTILSNAVQINYISVISEFIKDDESVYRISGDGGEVYWGLQQITKKSK